MCVLSGTVSTSVVSSEIMYVFDCLDWVFYA